MKKKFVTTTYQLNKYLPNGPQAGCLRFVFVSDLHNVLLGMHNEELLAAIKRQKPDAVLIGGDMIVGKPGISMEPAMEFIRNAAGEYPVYYANGNHEHRLRIHPEIYGTMYERLEETLQKAGVIHLVNGTAYVKFGGIPVAIHGFEADQKYYQRHKKEKMPVSELTTVFGSLDQEHYHILLAHNPVYKDAYLKWGADLTLAGHCHGGVVRLGEHYGLISTNMKLFYKYCHGKFEGNEGNCMIVSAGMGEHTVPVRIHNPRELVVVEIHYTVR